MQSSNKSTSWGGVADWYDGVVEHQDSYQKTVVLPNLLRMMKIKSGDRIFDIACGQGFFARAFASAGAHVVASDISSELIAIAQKSSASEIDFHVASANECEFIAAESIDTITIILALQNIERVAPVMSAAVRALRHGGKMFLVLNHPVFRNPGKSAWGWDEKTRTQFRRVDEYLTEKKQAMQMHPGADPTNVTFSFHRPLQLYVKHLARVGCAVTALEEWVSDRVSTKGARSAAENKSRAEIPLFMCIEATKLFEKQK